MKAGVEPKKKEFLSSPKFHSTRRWTSFMRAIKRKESNKRVHPRGSGKRMKRF